MLNFKSVCVVLVVCFLAFCTSSCNPKNNSRYISENDTTYSMDIRSISKKINENSGNSELYYKRANTFYFEDNFRQALQDINYAIKLDSTNALYEFKRAQYLISGDTADAREADKSFKKAIRLNPEYVEAMLAYGKLLIARQAYPEAEEMYTRCNKLDPSNPLPYFYIGLLTKEKGDTLKAIALFEKTLVYDGNYYDAVMQIGNYYALKNNPKALVMFDRAIAINPYSDEPLYAKGLYLQKKGLYKDAAALYEEVAKMNPAHIFCRYNMAYINALFGNYEAAKALLDATIELDEKYADAYALRGLTKEKLNNHTGAMMDYQTAIQLDKDNQPAKDGLKRLKFSISF